MKWLGVLGHVSALSGYTGPGTTWAQDKQDEEEMAAYQRSYIQSKYGQLFSQYMPIKISDWSYVSMLMLVTIWKFIFVLLLG